MKKITVANYRQDPYYARIVKAVEGLLREKGFVAPLELFIRLDLLSPESVENRRRGRIAHLERAMRCNLADDAGSTRISAQPMVIAFTFGSARGSEGISVPVADC